jgi:hypothetical protein
MIKTKFKNESERQTYIKNLCSSVVIYVPRTTDYSKDKWCEK